MLPNLTYEERNQLALDVIHYCNLFPRVWEGRACWILGYLLHTITHPGVNDTVKVARGNQLVAALKKDKGLWIRVQPFFEAHEYSKKCRCKHTNYEHRGTEGCCIGRVEIYNPNSALCTCLAYIERPL